MGNKDASAGERNREFRFTGADFERVRSLILSRAGIHLSDNKGEMVYSRLARRLRALGDASVSDYLERLDDPASEEWESFVNALTTNLTAFFREKHHFDTLVEHFRGFPQSKTLRVWCCAASTGEEPYSIAMALKEGLGVEQRVEIIASDIDTAALAKAREGIYALERTSKLEKRLLHRYFLKGTGANAGRTRIKSTLGNTIDFREINLLDRKWPLEGLFDAIFCRNVFIYFNADTQRELLRRFHQLLNPEGLFFAGHSESLLSNSRDFRALGRTVFAPLPLNQRRREHG